ncbi:MAG: hypothetical protein ACREM2_11150, partial [Vulcanimicrobiaceae bacterium]
ATGASLGSVLERIVEETTVFGDVGRAMPSVWLVYPNRIAELGTLAEPAQLLALAREDARGFAGDAPLGILAAARAA